MDEIIDKLLGIQKKDPMKRVYLDHAATTFVREEVIHSMIEVLQTEYGNPSSTYQKGRSAKVWVEKSRKTIANCLKVAAQEIVFTSCATEANNWVIHQAVDSLKVTRIITTRIEHHAVLHPIEKVHNKEVEVVYLSVNAMGQIDLDSLENLLIEPKTNLVTLMHVNNEIGTVLDLEKVSTLCHKYDAYFHTDAVQSIGKSVIDLQKTPLHFLVASAHKFHGPKGVGFLYVKKNTPFASLFLGGAQEKGWRAGTEAVHQIVGMCKALELSYQNLKFEKELIEAIKRETIIQLKNHFPGVQFVGGENQFYTILNVILPWSEEKSSLLLFHLDMKGVEVSRGSACQSGSQKPSHVLSEILSAEDLKKPNIRISFCHQNTVDDIEFLIDALQEINNVKN
jgi:cysteine desulfurase